MSDRSDDIEPILLALEKRVVMATDRIRELVIENNRLRISGPPDAVSPGDAGIEGAAGIRNLENRIAELDRERLNLLADRRALTQRVEDILARLEFLESESVTH